MKTRTLDIAQRLLALPLAVLLAGLGIATAMADPARWKAEGWRKTDFSKASVDFASIMSGGPPKDGIPAIDEPKFVPAGKVDWLGRLEPVIGLEIAGDARAYPLQVLMWHEIVNDTVGGTPVAVTYCPLCNSAVVFERRLDDAVLDFGTTGKLRNSDLVMYDRQSESWWQQFTGEAIVGTYTGRTLKTIPTRLESFERFKARFAEGKVLVPNEPGMRPYGRNPYTAYDTSGPFLYQGSMPEGIEPMARVVVVKIGGTAHAVTLDLVRRQGRVMVGDVEVSWHAGQNSALDAQEISQGRDVGNVVARRGAGESAVDVPYDVTFAFVFHAFHPDRPIRKS